MKINEKNFSEIFSLKKPPNNEWFTYEERVVIFLDILGWKAFIKASEENQQFIKEMGNTLYNIHFIINDMVPALCHHLTKIEITHFSDSIVISLLCNEHTETQMASILQLIYSTLTFSGGLFLRGGITKGKIFHRGSAVFGPALVRAYELESKDIFGKWPRILLDPDKFLNPSPKSWEEDSGNNGIDNIWRKDDDQRYFFDFLIPQKNIEAVPYALDCLFERYRELLIHGWNGSTGNISKLLKYGWLIRYFNSILEEYPHSTILAIPPMTSVPWVYENMPNSV